MSIADNWNQFVRLWNKKYGQREFSFMSEIEPPEQKEPQLSGFHKKLKQALNHNPREDKEE